MSEPQPIKTAPRNDDECILISTTGKAWFQASWDEDDGWVTFNRYVETHFPDREFAWRWWVPLPTLPE